MGTGVGNKVGMSVGEPEGSLVGTRDGAAVGAGFGAAVGTVVGICDGTAVGEPPLANKRPTATTVHRNEVTAPPLRPILGCKPFIRRKGQGRYTT